MFEWFKRNDIGRKLQAAVEDVINGDSWGPFEGLEKGEALVRVSLAKGEVIVFTKGPLILEFDEYPKVIRQIHDVTVEKAPELAMERVDEGPSVKEKTRRKRI
jgi:hypothetical protein